MNITVFGLGYVGLVTATCFAENNNKVICVDCDYDKISLLNNGETPIYEPGLQDLIVVNYQRNTLEFTTDAEYAVKESDLIFIAVDAPTAPDGEVLLTNVMQVSKSIGKYTNAEKIIINKSTVPVGTTYKIKLWIQEEINLRKLSIPFRIVANPEFLQEGKAIYNFQHPDRVIIGIEQENIKIILKNLYSPFVENSEKLIFVDLQTAEFSKYAANAMLATKISFINEIALLAESFTINIKDVCKTISLDPRIGPHFIEPGCGYGGACLAKDLKALIKNAKKHKHYPLLLQAVDSVNNNQKKYLFEKLQKYFANNIDGLTIAIWGLAFKPNTNDIRDASSCSLIEALLDHNAVIKAFDPQAMNEASKIYGGRNRFQITKTKEESLINADTLVICTEWQEFINADLEVMAKLLKNKVIFDGRNIFDHKLLKKAGFNYYGIGYGDNVTNAYQVENVTEV